MSMIGLSCQTSHDDRRDGAYVRAGRRKENAERYPMTAFVARQLSGARKVSGMRPLCGPALIR
jgi:hypothetical protein